jgi:hypothetical protein
MNAELAQIIRDSVVTVGAASTAIAAWRGLTTWRTQMVGKERHRVAVELLRAAIRWRIAMRNARNPMMFAQEMEPLPEEEEQLLRDRGDACRGSARGYTRRWNKVQEHRAELEAAVVEGEMYLGEWVPKWFSDLLDLEIELRFAIQEQLRAQELPQRTRDTDSVEQLRKRDAILYGGSRDDKFGASLQAKVEELKRLVKDHFS